MAAAVIEVVQNVCIDCFGLCFFHKRFCGVLVDETNAPSNRKPLFKTNGASKAIMLFLRGKRSRTHKEQSAKFMIISLGQSQVEPSRAKPLKIVYFMDESIDGDIISKYVIANGDYFFVCLYVSVLCSWRSRSLIPLF